MRNDWARNLWERLRRFEPARLVAVRTALVNLLAALGITLSTNADAEIGAAFAAVSILLSLLQGESTRRRVWSPGRVDPLRLAEPPVGAQEG